MAHFYLEILHINEPKKTFGRLSIPMKKTLLEQKS